MIQSKMSADAPEKNEYPRASRKFCFIFSTIFGNNNDVLVVYLFFIASLCANVIVEKKFRICVESNNYRKCVRRFVIKIWNIH